jgi:hypothetical protein
MRRIACSRCDSLVGLAGLLLPALHAAPGGFVEALVELAPHVVDDGRLGLRHAHESDGGKQSDGGKVLHGATDWLRQRFIFQSSS